MYTLHIGDVHILSYMTYNYIKYNYTNHIIYEVYTYTFVKFESS